MIPRLAFSDLLDFWEPLSPGWFIQWALEDLVRKHPHTKITVISEAYGPICGSIPAEFDKAMIVYADDIKIEEAYRYKLSN